MQCGNAMLSLIVTRGLLIAATLLPLAIDAAGGCRSLLPKELTATVVDQSRDWRLVEIADLGADDIDIWKGLHQGPCPSVAKGDFDGTGTSQFALLLTDKTKKRFRLLHAAKSEGGGYALRTIFEGRSSTTPVIYAGPAGNYSGAQSAAPIVLTKSPVIMAVLEAGATAYYFEKGQLRSLVIAE